MKSFLMGVTCPRCGSDLKDVTIGKPMDGGTAINAVVKCTSGNCRREYSIHVFLMAVGVYNDDGVVHGTAPAVRQHHADGEPLCEDCKNYRTRVVQDKNNRHKETADA